MNHSILRIVLKVIFRLIGIILIAKSLSSFGLSFISVCEFPSDYRLRLLAAYLLGEAVIGLVCYFAPENNPIDDFVLVSHQGAAFGSGLILLNVLIYEFPDYAKINSLFSVLILIVCASILISFFKVQKKRESLEKRRQIVWWR